MVEALVALLVAVFLVFVFSVSWVARLAEVGGVGFCFYVAILCVEWLVGRIRSNP